MTISPAKFITTSPAADKGSSAQGVAWDLRDLYAGVADPKITHDLESALARARTFESTYRGQIDVPGGPPLERIVAAVNELESLYEQMDKPIIYASLVHAARTDDPEHGKLLARTRERR